ncbi:unnamed protein product, partial [Meganyctiphanes norvegica]
MDVPLIGLATLLVCLGPSVAEKGGSWSALSFSVEPTDLVVRKGAPAWLHCLAKGNPRPTLTWRRDNSPIDTHSDSHRQILSNGTLFFQYVNGPRSDHPDEGVYQCVASAPGTGTIISTTAKLSTAALPKFEEQPESMSVFEGERARFACSIKGTPSPTIIWYRNGHKLTLDSRMTLLPSGALEIENVAALDEGKYYCMATLLDKTKTSSNANLEVKAAFALRDPSPPVFIARPKSLIAAVRDNLTLDCSANGYPTPSIVWLKDGATIDMADLDSRFLFHGSTHSLQVLGVQEQDGGSYMCRAQNREDSADAVAHVRVNVSPRFLRKPENTFAYQKEDIELECNVYGQPTPTVHWLKNGELIVESEYFQIVNGNNLKILGLVSTDSGMYQCLASNSAGDVQASAQLLVLKSDPESSSGEDVNSNGTGESTGVGVPSAPQHLQAIISSNRFVTLSWHEPQHNNEHIIGYSVFYKQEGSLRERVQNVSASSSSEGLDEYKTQISHLTPGSSYLVRVVAHTITGLQGKSTQEVLVYTKPDLDLPAAPTELKVVPTSPISLHVTWVEPPQAKTPIKGYTMYYMQVGSAEEHEVEVSGQKYDLGGLAAYTEYSVWLVAVNNNGAGDATHEVTARTFSDVPSKEPQNVTVEPASSRSFIVQWEAPPPEHQNGIITGYKIRFKERGTPGSTSETTDGNRRLYAINGLKKSTTYSVKVAALTVNGTGPSTHWITAETFASDLDENKVPSDPVGLRAVALTDSIQVRWQPPSAKNVMVRGYTIGWGRGIPDVYSKIVDSKQRYYLIENLEPNSEYVISLRAFNNIGDGKPVYEQVRTRPAQEKVEATLTPPIGLKAEVLTPFTVALQWTDTTLNLNQYISDTRFYRVRYTTFSSASSSSPRFRYLNATDVTALIDGLKPSTVYEFAVKTIKGRRESPWSLVASNTTLEARPASPPRDVTVVTLASEPTTTIFNWQPPKQANGKINGYLIFYTTDASSDWAMAEVVGDRMTYNIRGLTPATLYFYKMQAQNRKGFGPFTAVGNFTTPPALPSDVGGGLFVGNGGNMVVVVVACVAAFITCLGVIIGITLYCRHVKVTSHVATMAGSGGTNKSGKVEVKPPDLWIHHDHLELKNLNQNERSGSPNHATIINHSGEYYEANLKKVALQTVHILLINLAFFTEKLKIQSISERTKMCTNQRTYEWRILISKLMVGGSTSSSVYSEGTLGRPGYSQPQYSAAASSQGYNSPAENPYSPNPTSMGSGISNSSPYDSCLLPPQASGPLLGSLGAPSSSQYSSGNGEGSNTLGKNRSGNPLRSFSVPAPPQSAPTTPQPKHIVAVRPQGVTSPFKKPLGSNSGSGLGTTSGQGSSGRWGPLGRVDSLPEHEEGSEGLLHHGYSTEELTQEMANLEGLMKDLSAITANQFNC